MTPTPGRVPVRVIFSVATALGFFSAFAAFYFVSTFTDKPAAFGLLLALNLGYWYSWAALTPAILCLTRRFPFDRTTWKMAVPVHIAGVVIVTSLHVVLTVALRSLENQNFGFEQDRRTVVNIDPQLAGYRAGPADGINSLHADRLAGRPMEIDARNGVIVRKGAAYGIATPVNAMVVALLEAAGS